MNIIKTLGVYLDHSAARLIEYGTSNSDIFSVYSKFDHQAKVEGLTKSEHIMHEKEQHQQQQYYKNIAEKLKGYSNIVLYGPTDAKFELKNVLHESHFFNEAKIHTESTDKLNEMEQREFVATYFNKAL
jgi:stalled ribosome rescue protein Dom34